MSASAQYEHIQAFKRHPNAVVDGVNYAHVVATMLYDTSLMGLTKTLGYALVFSPRITISGSGGHTLVFYSNRHKRRADYDYIARRLVQAAGERATIVETEERFSLMQPWRTLRSIPRAWRATLGGGRCFAWRVRASALVAKYLSISPAALRVARMGARVVTFCDASPMDNLVAQFAAREGAVTLTAQHGQYRVLDAGDMSPNAEAYANFVSDRLLCWGKGTVAEFERAGIARERLEIVGWIREWPDPPLRKEVLGVFGVMLNGANGAESNAGLIDAANSVSVELDMQYVVRLHPSFTPDRYARLVNDRCQLLTVMSTADYLGAVDFSIAHDSSTVVEMLYVDSPVYVLDDGHLAAIFRHPGLAFKTTHDLIDGIQADQVAVDGGQERARELSTWYNDDQDQDGRLRAAILGAGV